MSASRSPCRFRSRLPPPAHSPTIIRIAMTLEGIDHVALAVTDVERSAAWFIDVLGFERRFDGMWDGLPVFVGKGETAIALFPRREPLDSATVEQRNPNYISRLHLAFRAGRENFFAAKD